MNSKKIVRSFRNRIRSKRYAIESEFKSVTTIDLACKAEKWIGKLFWLSLLLIGIAWAVYFIGLVFFEENPVVVTSLDDVKLTDLKKPAITMCFKGTTKFAIAERLGNFLQPHNQSDEILPENILAWTRMLKLCATIYRNYGFENENMDLAKAFFNVYEFMSMMHSKHFRQNCFDGFNVKNNYPCQVSLFFRKTMYLLYIISN